MTHKANVTDIFEREDIVSLYKRAEAFEHETNTESMVLNAQIFPHWIDNSNCFWYVRKKRLSTGKIAKEYRLVDAEAKNNQEAFDHNLLAQRLGEVCQRDVDPSCLPITQLKLELLPRRLRFRAFGKSWLFYASEGSCKEVSGIPSNWLLSPDGKKAAFLRTYNLWIQDLESGEECALTQDGEHHWAYGVQPERVNLVAGLNCEIMINNAIPEAFWSPDSKKILTVRVDERRVLTLPLTKYVPTDGSVRPQSIATKYALPNDEHIVEYRLAMINVETKEVSAIDYPDIADSVLWAGLFSGNRAWWSSDSCHAYFVDMERGQKLARVVGLNVQTGITRVLFEEKSDTFIDLGHEFESPAYLIPLPKTNELIWFSERSGWAHLYLYDLTTGELKHPITKGDWLVREIVHVDTSRRELILQITGRVADRDPYYREVCRVYIDSGEIETLASSNHHYVVCNPPQVQVRVAVSLGMASMGCAGVSPNGDYIVITRTRADEVPVTDLIDRDGKLIVTVEDADVSGLPERWQWPEPVKLLAADGKTDIYGLVFRPTDFSPEKKYPVLDWSQNNPFYSFVTKSAFDNTYRYMAAAAYAELGFIVVTLDGRGTCNRSKAFHDEAYGQVHTGGNLEDHVVGIRQLAERYPYMDLDRVGITDVFGSNSPIYGLLAFPDFYKVGTVYSIWDVRLLTQGETYQGLGSEANYTQSVLGNMASNLQGKLLIMQGLMDSFFHVSGVFQIINALVKENKDFDLVLLPNGGHALDSCHYGLRKSWDYLVKHLKGQQPPLEFRLSNGVEHALKNLETEII